MIFYRIETVPPQIVGTQDKAREVSRLNGKAKWTQIDIPTDKTGLAAFVNGLLKMTVHDEQAIIDKVIDDALAEADTIQDNGDIPLHQPTPGAFLPQGPSFAERNAAQRAEEMATLMGVKREIVEITNQIMTMEGESLGQVGLAVASRFQELAS